MKEKEAHIDQLLKERDLERAEITRAASQADHAEQALAVLKNEYQQVRKTLRHMGEQVSVKREECLTLFLGHYFF